MAKNQAADQTEKPTPKRLKDARKDGEVSKSKELTSTVLVLWWLVMAWLAAPLVSQQLRALLQDILGRVGKGDPGPMTPLLIEASRTLLLVTLPLLLGAGLLGLLTDFLQVGALFVPKRLIPQTHRLNPLEGLKRMFTQDNLIEVLKSVFKTAALSLIFVVVLLRLLPQILRLPLGQPADLGTAHWQVLQWVGIWTVCVFFLLAVLDAIYQRFSFMKKLRMSRRDIRHELRETEGDPYIKGQRRYLQQEWAQQNMLAAVRKANAVVVNPEHVAVAVLYEPDTTALPIVCAKGEDYEAQLIREAAAEAGVPIMRNVELARALHEHIGVDEYITSEFFQAIAELLRWAESVRQHEQPGINR
jgi:type III secretion protein U